jgi:hypothetical protein
MVYYNGLLMDNGLSMDKEYRGSKVGGVSKGDKGKGVRVVAATTSTHSIISTYATTKLLKVTIYQRNQSPYFSMVRHKRGSKLIIDNHKSSTIKHKGYAPVGIAKEKIKGLYGLFSFSLERRRSWKGVYMLGKGCFYWKGGEGGWFGVNGVVWWRLSLSPIHTFFQKLVTTNQ